MTDAASSRSWLVPVFALFVATFAICTAELIIAGLLPALAADLSVDIPTAGLLITGYALGVAVASPILALLTGDMSRRGLLVGVMVAFVAGNILCAVSSSYWMLLGARLVVACAHGLFFGVAMVLAMRLAPPGRQSSAVSLVVAGVTLANILGVPAGTAIGNAYGWRATFWVIALVGVLAGVALLLLVRVTTNQSAGASLRDQLQATAQPVVLLCYLAIAFFMTGVFCVLAYIVPMLSEVSGVPVAYVPLVLLGMGAAGFFGNLLGGRLGDTRPMPTMVGILSINIVLLVVLSQVLGVTWAAIGLLVAIWFVGFGFPAPVQTRILTAASAAPNFASTLISTAFNVGIASGAALGGAALAGGWGYHWLPLLYAGFMGLALLTVVGLAVIERGRRPALA